MPCIVNNNTSSNLSQLEDLTKKNITIVNLSKKVEKNSAVIAGLDQANGDYTAVIDLSFWENPMIISNLYNKIQSGFDFVYFILTVLLLYFDPKASQQSSIK